MLVKKRAILAAILGVILAVGSLLISTCAPKEIIKIVEVTAPPGQVIVEVEVTSPPEIVEATVEVPVSVTTEPVEEARDLPAGCTYNAYVMGWVMDYPDPENMLNVVFHPDSPFQSTFWDDQAYRDLVDRALLEQNFDARVRLWQQAEDILVTDHAVVIPIFHYDRTALVHPEIEVEYTPFGWTYYMKWRLPAGQETLRVRLSNEPASTSLDPSIGGVGDRVLDQLMEAPYRYTGDGAIEQAGAESFEVSDDGLVYTIHLRQGATWSDGVPVTAQHYVDGIIRFLDPTTAADYAPLMYLIQGAEAFNTGESDDPSVVGVRAVDDHALEITLEQAASYFDSNLASGAMYPIRLDVIEQYDDRWTELGNFVGNGPYLLTEWVHDDYIAIEKNPDYWGADGVTIERVEFHILAEEATMMAAYESGELDVNDVDVPVMLPRILEEMPDHIRRVPWPGTYYADLNTLRPPTDNLNFRKALASTVDRWAIIDEVTHTPWRIAACGVVPPEIAGYQGCGKVGYEFDPAAAQEYLLAALDEMGIEEPADISINLWTNRGMEDLVEAIVEMWESNLGIEVNVAIMEYDAYLEILDVCGS